MKRILFGVIIFSSTLGLFLFLNNKFNNIKYTKMASDMDNYYIVLGTKTILEEVMINEKLNWGKNNDNSKRNNYYRYIELNLNESKKKLKSREYDKYNQKMTQYIKLLEEMYELKNLVGEDYETFVKKHDNIIKKINIKQKEVEEVLA